MNDIAGTLRKLAKTDYFQAMYSHAKELRIKIFENDSDFTRYQITFLAFLSMYSSILTDVYLKEVDEIVLKDEIYEDAYLYYRRNKDKNIKKKNEAEQEAPPTQWLFKKPAKGN